MTNILHGPVVEQGPTEVFVALVVEEVELLLFDTSARALTAAVLSVLFSSQEMSVKQVRLIMIKLTVKKEFDKYFSFCKKKFSNIRVIPKVARLESTFLESESIYFREMLRLFFFFGK